MNYWIFTHFSTSIYVIPISRWALFDLQAGKVAGGS
jgi:hypothetical protein